uniref:YqaJ viral recombinase domain-containing protein n=1 Tax=Phytophthora ramorum TaxID=164328 RepID=H3GEH4_PHYRM
MGGRRALGRNIMIFASEVPVISALNPYRKIEDVFLDVWRRTNPRQVSQLQERLSLALPSPEEKMQAVVQDLGAAPAIHELIQEAAQAENIQQVAQAQAKVEQSLPSATPAAVKAEVVQFVTSTMHKGFGVKQETAGIEQYQEKRKVIVNERNLVFSKKKVATVGSFDVLVGGKIDGRADGKVIEVKNRLKRFITPLPKYDIAQLQTYLYILDGQEGELVEHLHAEEAQTKTTKVPWDDKMWSADIEPYLIRFGSALTYLMKDRTAQSDYLQSDGGQQREIIRYLWSQDVQRTE